MLEYDTNTKTNVHDIDKIASTTGNITGVYDMSGGRDEYVMGSYLGWSIGMFSTMPDSKYYDYYSLESYKGTCTIEECGGHALYETYGWYNDVSSFVDGEYPLLLRGGDYIDGAKAGIFNFGTLGYRNAAGNRSAHSVISYVG